MARKKRLNLKDIIVLINNYLGPVPQYSLNPFYKLGTLIAIAFIIEIITGLLMLPHYEPTLEGAYASTRAIIGRLPYGNIIMTLHLYTAYFMIFLTFVHLMRNYFMSTHKLRKGMWILGVIMGLIILGLNFTGHFLPWTMVSKLHLDLLIKVFKDLPFGEGLIYFLMGSEGNGALLTQFYYLHVVILPLTFIALLILKARMLISQGLSEPIIGRIKNESKNLVPRFPVEFSYILMLASLLIASLLSVSALFPLKLPPEYSSITTNSYIPKLGWYFLWIYELSRIFPIAKGLLALIVALIITLLILFMPLIDKFGDRHPTKRPIFTTLGIILIIEIIGLTIWGYLAPKVSHINQVIIISGLALLATVSAYLYYYKNRKRLRTTWIQTHREEYS